MSRSTLVVTALACAVLVPVLQRVTGLPSAYWSVIIGIGVAYALMALSLNFMLGHAGLLSLGHAGFIAIGAFASGLATTALHLPMAVGFALAIAIGCVAALAVSAAAARLEGIYLAIGTVAFAVLIEELLLAWTEVSGGRSGIALPRPMVGSFVFSNEADYLALLLVTFAAFLALDINLTASRLGRAMHVTRWSQVTAGALGVDVTRTRAAAILLAGAAGAGSGSLYGHLVGLVTAQSFAVNAQQNLSLVLVMLVILGGPGNAVAIAAACGVFAIGPVLIAPLRAWEFVLGGILLMAAVVRHPEGLGKSFARPRPGAALPAKIALPSLEGIRESSPPRLRVEDLTVEFDGYKALDEVTLEVREGNVHGLIGPNGAGKSTLLAAVGGQVTYEGSITLDDRPIDHLAHHRRAQRGIVRTFQTGGLVPDVSLRENLLLSRERAPTYASAVGLLRTPSIRKIEALLSERVEAACDLLGLSDRVDEPAGVLSTGQQRVVEIVRALLSAPDLLLLDEPSSGLAPSAVMTLVDHLDTLRSARSVTVVVVDHSAVVRRICDRVTALEAGQVVATGSPVEVSADPRVASYLGAV